MYCRILERVSERLEGLGGLYTSIVEPVMGYPRHREHLAQALARGGGCSEACLALSWLESRIHDSRTCIVGPGGVDSRYLEGCDAIAGPEGGIPVIESLGVKMDYTTGDGDIDQKLYTRIGAYTRLYLLHVHGDNIPLNEPALPPEKGVLYTSQVARIWTCMIAPLGFTDGDRAVILAMALGAREVRMYGYWGRARWSHKASQAWEARLQEKTSKMRLSSTMITEAASRLGYSVGASMGGGPVLLRKKNAS